MSVINTALLKQAIEKGWILVHRHPTQELYIHNYTAKVQYEGAWNEITLSCRGLILDAAYNVVARPFAKFFNLGEQTQDIPDSTFEVYEKMDGSLGILYWIDEQPYIATRGSFTSIQAEKANELLHGKYSGNIPLLDKTRVSFPLNRSI